MENIHVGLSPGCPDDFHQRLWNVLEFWNELVNRREDSGETSWGVLERLYDRVCQCLGSRPIRLREAEALTAEAAMRISGRLLF
jgi:hypothetical protein